MTIGIQATKLSKHYQLGETTAHRYQTLRESIMNVVGTSWQRLVAMGRSGTSAEPNAESAGGRSTGSCRSLWALRDVDFEVRTGEIVGVVGRNGAGKSTLLKIISRITSPTSGSVELRGRVGSLLEVGTGFHPELTGRENIYLNGAVLGMSRREVARKFDAIVEFAEVGRFLDTPVKRYSSGMHTRLGFAVASHLEPEILIVDEVLAVGDSAFQKKCLGKMDQISRQGRAILFVSHNMAAIKSLCTRALLLDAGRVVLNGTVDQVLDQYLSSTMQMSRTGVIPTHAPRQRDVLDEASFRSVRLLDCAGREVSQLHFGQPFRVRFECDVMRTIPDAQFEISFSTLDGIQISCTTTRDGDGEPLCLRPGRHEVTAEFDVVLLPRDYSIDLGVHHFDGRAADHVQRTFDFSVVRVAENGVDHYRWERTRGYLHAPARWHFQQEHHE